MQLFTVFITLSAAFGAALAADVCRPTSSDCFGTAVCCFGIAAGGCCGVGATNRIKFVLPANSRGVAYTGTSCNGTPTTTQKQTAGTICVNYSNLQQSAKWLNGLAASRVRRDSEAETCAEPNGIIKLIDGVPTRIDVLEGQTIEDAFNASSGTPLDLAATQGDLVSA